MDKVGIFLEETRHIAQAKNWDLSEVLNGFESLLAMYKPLSGDTKEGVERAIAAFCSSHSEWLNAPDFTQDQFVSNFRELVGCVRKILRKEWKELTETVYDPILYMSVSEIVELGISNMVEKFVAPSSAKESDPSQADLSSLLGLLGGMPYKKKKKVKKLKHWR